MPRSPRTRTTRRIRLAVAAAAVAAAAATAGSASALVPWTMLCPGKVSSMTNPVTGEPMCVS